MSIEHVGYLFRLAKSVSICEGEVIYSNFDELQFSFKEPDVPEGALKEFSRVYKIVPLAQDQSTTDPVASEAKPHDT